MWPVKKMPVLEQDGLRLRLPRRSDFRAWQNIRSASRSFLTPVEPRWHEYELTRASFSRRVRLGVGRAAARTEFSFLIFVLSDAQLRQKEVLVGGITLSNIRYGAACHCNIGYWLGHAHVSKGHMNRALSLVLPFAFYDLGLRRIHAACLPENHRSKNVLVKNGFEEEGFARKYLQIDGEFRDHLLFGLTRDRFVSIKGDSAKSL